jgi:Asp/Glu/hydantoin racemase
MPGTSRGCDLSRAETATGTTVRRISDPRRRGNRTSTHWRRSLAPWVCCGLLRPLRDAARKAVDVPIVKIDDAMAEYVAARASRIGVLATVPTTLGPTADLIRAHATGLGRDVCSVVR